VPVAIPLTLPVVDPTVAKVTFELVQVPPVVVLVKLMLSLTQTADGPEIGATVGVVITVTDLNAVSVPHIFETIYLMFVLPKPVAFAEPVIALILTMAAF
jgi:hypothetical protein